MPVLVLPMASVVLKHIVNIAEIHTNMVRSTIEILCIVRPRPANSTVQAFGASIPKLLQDAVVLLARTVVVRVATPVELFLLGTSAGRRGDVVGDTTGVEEVDGGILVAERADSVEAKFDRLPFLLFAATLGADGVCEHGRLAAVLVTA